tara:strand:+ start:2542 stop:2793 length:252 start_codon:yes stop_codon:yes gene_type:complete
MEHLGELPIDLQNSVTIEHIKTGYRHGGCHPVGLALAAQARGFNAKVNINSSEPLFVDGVRSEDKKQMFMNTLSSKVSKKNID